MTTAIANLLHAAGLCADGPGQAGLKESKVTYQWRHGRGPTHLQMPDERRGSTMRPGGGLIYFGWLHRATGGMRRC